MALERKLGEPRTSITPLRDQDTKTNLINSRQILTLLRLGQGGSIEEIAAELRCSPITVKKTYLGRAVDALDTGTTYGTILLAKRLGLFSAEELLNGFDPTPVIPGFSPTELAIFNGLTLEVAGMRTEEMEKILNYSSSHITHTMTGLRNKLGLSEDHYNIRLRVAVACWHELHDNPQPNQPTPRM